jgi:hypothetical protein
LEEIALWAKAYNIKDQSKLNLLVKMISVKSKNAIAYNELIKKLLAIN